MNDIRFSCLRCQQSLEAPPDMAGMNIECPACQAGLVVPAIPHNSAPESRARIERTPGSGNAILEDKGYTQTRHPTFASKRKGRTRWYVSCLIVALCAASVALYVTWPPFSAVAALAALGAFLVRLRRDKKARDASACGPAPAWLWRTVCTAVVAGIVALGSTWVPFVSLFTSILAASLGLFCFAAARGYRRTAACALLLAVIAVTPQGIRRHISTPQGVAAARTAAWTEFPQVAHPSPAAVRNLPVEPTVNTDSIQESIDAMKEYLRQNNRDDELAWLNVAIGELIRRGEVQAAEIRGLTAGELVAYTGVRRSGKTAGEAFRDIAEQVAAKQRTERGPEPALPSRPDRSPERPSGSKVSEGARRVAAQLPDLALRAFQVWMAAKMGSPPPPSEAPGWHIVGSQQPAYTPVHGGDGSAGTHAYGGRYQTPRTTGGGSFTRHPGGVQFTDRSGNPAGLLTRSGSGWQITDSSGNPAGTITPRPNGYQITDANGNPAGALSRSGSGMQYTDANGNPAGSAYRFGGATFQVDANGNPSGTLWDN